MKVARIGREGFRRGPYSTQNRTAKAAIFSSDGMTSQRQRPAARRERSIPLRPRAIVKPLIRHDKVDAAVAQRFDAFRRSIDHRLFMDVETRVDEGRKPRLALERAKDIVVKRVFRPVDNLRPRRMVNVYNRGIRAHPSGSTSHAYRQHGGDGTVSERWPRSLPNQCGPLGKHDAISVNTVVTNAGCWDG